VAGAVLRDALAASLAAWLALLPLQLALFGRCNPLAPLLNLVAVPLAGLATGLSLAAAALALLSERAAGLLLAAVDRLAALLGLVDAGDFALAAGGVGPVLAAAWTASLLAAARGTDPRLRFAAVLLAAVAGRELLFGWTRPLPPGVEAAVTVLDVGQGSATLVETRSGERGVARWLVDGGGRPGSVHDVGARTVVPALRALGLRRLDGVVMSHADQDHRGGLPAVLRELRPAAVLAGPVPAEDLEVVRGFLEEAARAGARTGRVARGSRAGALPVLGPPRERGARRGLSGNDLSVVLSVPGGDGRDLALLPGDVEAAGEGALAAAPTAVLVVAHHGSRTSTTPGLLAVLRPRVAIVSAGAGNRFGHPHADVLARLAASGARAWTTASDGAMRVELRGRLLHVRTARGGGGVLALDGPRGAWEDPPP
jgi:competence protein ComEC